MQQQQESLTYISNTKKDNMKLVYCDIAEEDNINAAK